MSKCRRDPQFATLANACTNSVVFLKFLVPIIFQLRSRFLIVEMFERFSHK